MPRSKKSPKQQRLDREDRARPAEQLLMDELDRFTGTAILCTTLGRGQLAVASAERPNVVNVRCWMLDAYLTEQAMAFAAQKASSAQFECQADPSPGEIDLALIPTHTGGEAELTRETLQTAHAQLQTGGTLAASVDNPADVWLHQVLQEMFDKVTVVKARRGVIYIGRKTAPLKKVRDFACDLAFRDGERLLKLCTRPGVFSHRRVDGGARALIERMTVEEGQQVLDLGCGSGAVGLAAAARAECRVIGIDSNARAVECTNRGAAANGLASRLSAHLDADGHTLDEETFDLVLANPPYFSNYRIAELFVSTAERVLRQGGRLQIVTKHPDWFLERLRRTFTEVDVAPQRQYLVISATRRRRRHRA